MYDLSESLIPIHTDIRFGRAYLRERVRLLFKLFTDLYLFNFFGLFLQTNANPIFFFFIIYLQIDMSA